MSHAEDLHIDGPKLLQRLATLGEIGRDANGRLSRLAFTDADRAARDLVVDWMRELDLEVSVDSIGNIFGQWPAPAGDASVMVGSHLDSVVDAGILDGPYGVLGALAAVEAIRSSGTRPRQPLCVAVFSNEEGVRYTPDMMGSLVHAGGADLATILDRKDRDGIRLGDELARIGYAGELGVGTIVPRAFLELHIEQGPILEAEGLRIGAVEDLQGISWQRVTVEGTANHAGTTPMRMRRDAGIVAAEIAVWIRSYISASSATTVGTVGSIELKPNLVNVVPGRATVTVDLRDPDEERLRAAESALERQLEKLAEREGVSIHSERLVRFEPVRFDAQLVARIEAAATRRQLPCRRMTSGAGHDAQMMARVCPAAMIFVPSRDGVSHNPAESTHEVDLVAGANVLLDVLNELIAT